MFLNNGKLAAYHFKIENEFNGSKSIVLAKLSCAVLIGLLAYTVDLARENPLYGISIHFWDFFIIFAALFMGPVSAAFTGLTLGLLLIFAPHNMDFFGFPHLFLLISQGFFIGALRYGRQPVRAFDSALLFWLCIGTPAYMLLFSPILEGSALAYLLDIFRYLGSGICSALMMQLICLSPKLSDRLDIFKYRQNSQREWPATIIFNMYLVSLIVIPVFIWLQYSVVVADNTLEKYLKTEMINTVNRVNSSIARDTRQSFHFSNFLQGQYIEGGPILFRKMAQVIIPDRPEIAAVVVLDRQGTHLAGYGRVGLLPRQEKNLPFDTYGEPELGQSIAVLKESLAVLRLKSADLMIETHTLLDLTRFTVLSKFPASPSREISIVKLDIANAKFDSNRFTNSARDASDHFRETHHDSKMANSSHLGRRLSTTMHYVEPLAHSDSYGVLYSIAIKDLVIPTIKIQLLTCLWGLLYILLALIILRLLTMKAIGRLSNLSDSADAWSSKKVGPFHLQKESSVREFNVLTASLENLVYSFVHENEKLTKAERELRAHSSELDSIFDSVNGPLLVFSKSGVLEQFNKAALLINNNLYRGITAKKVFTDMAPEWGFEHFEKAFFDASKGIVTDGKEVFVTQSDNTRIALLMSWAPLRKHNSIGGVIFAAQDITEKIESFNQVIHASKLATLGEMATGIAHEINQPLNIIRMAVENMELAQERGLLDDAMLGEKIERIISQIDRAAEIVNNVRSFGRKSLSEKVPVDVLDCAESTAILMNEQFLLDGINVTYSGTAERCVVMGEKIQLEQVFINLMTNARDVISANNIVNGHVDIEVSLADGDIIIQVKDNGKGIPPNALKNLFDPFFTTKPVGLGTGLGLSVSQRIISGMDGTIKAFNEGNGAVFLITLPACEDNQSTAFSASS